VATKSKLHKLAEAAYKYFQELPAEEQKNRIKAIRKLKFRPSKTAGLPHTPASHAQV
jgi:hypothetical protein